MHGHLRVILACEWARVVVLMCGTALCLWVPLGGRQRKRDEGSGVIIDVFRGPLEVLWPLADPSRAPVPPSLESDRQAR